MSFFLAPLAAHAVMYAPGATLDPGCAPTDPNCGVYSNTATGVTGQVPYYAANGNVLAATSTFTILANGYIGIGTSSPIAMLDITGTNSIATLGSEMIVNSDDRTFSTDTGKWTGTNWTIDAGDNNIATHAAGATVLTLDNSALSSAPVSGNIYKIVFTTI